MSKLYVFRHTTSQDNEFSIFSGGRNVPLYTDGYKEAAKLSESLKDTRIDIAFCSDLLRSYETLDIVLEHHPKVIKCVDPRIRERSYGLLEGQNKKQWAKFAYPIFKIIHRSFYIPPPGGESLKMVKTRVYKFIDELQKHISGRDINAAICAHSGSIRPIRQFYENLTDEESMKIETEEGQLFIYNVK